MAKQKEYQKGLVIFVDLQGTRAEENFLKKLNNHKAFHTKATVHVDEMAQAQNERPTDNFVIETKVFSFSDCAYYIFTWSSGGLNLDDAHGYKSYQTLKTSVFAIQELLSRGVMVRGGIVYGEVYVDEEGFFGPAIEKAYKLESSEAFYPKIMIEEKLGKHFYLFERNHIQKNPEFRPIIRLDSFGYYLNMFWCADIHQPDHPTAHMHWDNIKLNLYKTIADIEGKFDWKSVTEKEKMLAKVRWLKEEIKSYQDFLDNRQSS